MAFGLIVSTIGFISFTRAFEEEYAVSTYHMADTASVLVNGDHLEDYLDGSDADEYLRTKGYLDEYCRKMSVSLIYVIVVDQSDYGRFVSVFNSVNNEVDQTEYTEWELGHRRDTTNDEYRRKYRELYNGEALYETLYRLRTTDGQHPHVTTMVPVKNPAGEVKGILCMQRPAREIDDARRPYLISIAVSTVLLAVLASLFAAFYLRNRFVRPIRKVAEEATRFAKENTQGEKLSGISRYRELSALAESIDTMETEMLASMENLTSVTAEKERIGTELNLARKIQESSIPNIFPPFPERSEFDLFASMDPAREVGGDFYTFFLVDEDHLALSIGDVSGKGIPASLFMMVTNILINDMTILGGTPAKILSYVNNKICAHNSAEMFVTVWLGILEISTGRLTAANAGHEYPALKRAGGKYELFRDQHDFVVGGFPDIPYHDYEIQLCPGDQLFLYTDGIPEACDAREQLFGIDRMLETLNRNPGAHPEELLKSVRSAVNDFVLEAEQFDDLTMLCLEYRGNGERNDYDPAER